jgi:hypothetical protein
MTGREDVRTVRMVGRFLWDCCRECELWANAGAPGWATVTATATGGRLWTAGDRDREAWRAGELDRAAGYGPGAALWVADLYGGILDADSACPVGAACELCGNRASSRIVSAVMVPV